MKWKSEGGGKEEMGTEEEKKREGRKRVLEERD